MSGRLSDYGYKSVKSMIRDQREAVLVSAAAVMGGSLVIRQLSLLSIYNRNKNPELSRLFAEDMAFVQRYHRGTV